MVILQEPSELKLLPKLPNELTLTEICTKLPWITLGEISRVNSNWYKVITGGDVYREKVRKGKMEDFIAMKIHLVHMRTSFYLLTHSQFLDLDTMVIVFDPRQDYWVKLPRCPGVLNARIAVSKGILFVIGEWGENPSPGDDNRTMFFYDLGSCGNTWTRGPDMLFQRRHFACKSIKEKIYVCGGCNNKLEITSSMEVYDIETNVWDRLSDMPVGRIYHDILEVDGNLYIVDGRTTFGDMGSSEVDHLDVYNTEKDEWTSIPKCMKPPLLPRSSVEVWTKYFSHEGKLHQLNTWSVDVLSSDSNWTTVQYIIWNFRKYSAPRYVTFVDGELYVAVKGIHKKGRRDYFIMKSKGFYDSGSYLKWSRLRGLFCGTAREDWTCNTLEMVQIQL